MKWKIKDGIADPEKKFASEGLNTQLALRQARLEICWSLEF